MHWTVLIAAAAVTALSHGAAESVAALGKRRARPETPAPVAAERARRRAARIVGDADLASYSPFAGAMALVLSFVGVAGAAGVQPTQRAWLPPADLAVQDQPSDAARMTLAAKPRPAA